MADEVKLITFAGETVSPLYDGLMQELYTGGGGIITGAVVTIKDASNLHITGGYGALCGREFEIFASDIPVTLSSSGTLKGRLYLHMDLAQSGAPIELLVEVASSLTPVVQDSDVNTTNGVYEVNLATFDVGTSAISALADVAPKLVGIESSDLTSIKAVGSTNATGSTITKGTYFYLNGKLCLAKSDIATGATFTLNTNYEEVTAGGLNSLNSALDNFFDVVQTVQSFAAATSLSYTGKSITIPAKSFYSLMFNISYSNSLPQEICLSKSSTDVSPYNVFGRSSTALYLPLSGYTGNAPLTIYVWAKYATAATNNLYINGVTKTLG